LPGFFMPKRGEYLWGRISTLEIYAVSQIQR